MQASGEHPVVHKRALIPRCMARVFVSSTWNVNDLLSPLATYESRPELSITCFPSCTGDEPFGGFNSHDETRLEWTAGVAVLSHGCVEARAGVRVLPNAAIYSTC